MGTNHPTVEYTNEALLTLLHTHSRDDVIYALKQCAKRGFGMEPRWVWDDGTEFARHSRNRLLICQAEYIRHRLPVHKGVGSRARSAQSSVGVTDALVR